MLSYVIVLLIQNLYCNAYIQIPVGMSNQTLPLHYSDSSDTRGADIDGCF